MSNQTESRINQILAHLSSAAGLAADGVSDAVRTAGAAMNDKYDSFKAGFEVTRLQDEQKAIFTNIGQTMFMIKQGAFTNNPTDDEGNEIDPQELVDDLLSQAVVKQGEIDLAIARKNEAKAKGDMACPTCGKTAAPKDVFCSACGAKLPERETACDCGCQDEAAPEDKPEE